MKGKDKNSSSSGRTKALPAGRPPIHSGEEPSANPLAGRRRRQLFGLHIARAVALLSHRRWERNSGKQLRAGETKGMVKARAAPAIELLEDVVRTHRPASSEALPWRHPFALRHFLEGVQERCQRRNPRQALPSARRCRALGEAFCGDSAYHYMCNMQVVDITPMKHCPTSITSIRVVQQKHRRSKVCL
jgi:hypothetical protein